jgi:hypothetical protein
MDAATIDTGLGVIAERSCQVLMVGEKQRITNFGNDV